MLLLIRQLLIFVINIMCIIILADVVCSWMDMYRRNRNLLVIRQIADIVNEPIRKILPPISGLDFSPIVSVVILSLIARII